MWKDTIKKKDEEYEEGETLQSNNMMRDTRSAESYKTGDTMEITASNMNSPANRDLKNEAMSKILYNLYSAPKLESLLIDVMNKINRSL